MNEIKILDKLTASKIAAGEVVEKPVNVVKELLENALDSGASKIVLEIKEGGTELISVIDNGKGIKYEDLPLTIERFATSKAFSVEDVYNISTYGFRGEALAAISSVSLFSIKSIRDNSAGELISKFGKDITLKPAAISKGTYVSVANLFENLPVRKKFLKSKRSSEGEILRFVKQLSMHNAGVEFIVIFDEKEVYRTYPSQKLSDLAKIVFGESKTAHAELQHDNIKASVCVSHPSVQRGRKDGIYIGVNGRVIKDPALVQAVIQAYHRILPANAFPYAVVDLKAEPSLVDVNIHPAKAEIRFINAPLVFSLVKNAVDKALQSFSMKEYDHEHFSDIGFEVEEKLKALHNQELQESLEPTASKESFFTESPSKPAFDLTKEFTTAQTHSPNEFEPIMGEKTQDCGIKVIGQLSDTYILCETPDSDLLVIDQHVAHERVLYNKYLSERMQAIPSINLFEPIVVNLTDEEQTLLEELAPELEKFGYAHEIFGQNIIKICRVPMDMLKKDVQKEFKGILNDAINLKKSRTQDYAILTMSCRNAIKAGDRLNKFEMQHLIDTLFSTQNPYTCPHGRPIIYHINSKELAKKFHR